MTNVVRLTFNPFQENTYLVFDGTGECLIVDPGCFDRSEKEVLLAEIERRELTPVRLLNTHCHLDHVFGNAFVARQFGLELEIPEGELPVLASAPQAAMMFGVSMPEPSPDPGRFIDPGGEITFGDTRLEVLFTPGHSPASVSLYARQAGFVLAGDVLFQGSIGRTDLPGGDMATLLASIRDKLLVLPDETIVYPGHGPETSIGAERAANPFLQG